MSPPMRPGPAARVPSQLERAGEWLYRSASRLGRRFAPAPVTLPGAAVVSVGNLEVGGGGKTPCVLWWAQALAARGAEVAVVIRPWGPPTPTAPSDEAALLLERLPKGARLFTGPSKSKTAQRARAAGASAVVVDDGFSHHALGRDLDLLLLDARRPFGNGHCLPAGTLREPPESAARADAVVLTRADRADAESRKKAREQVFAAGYRGPVLQARHRVVGVKDGDALVPAAGLAVYCVSGLGRKGELAEAACAAGCKVEGSRDFPDHHAFTRSEWQAVEREAHARSARVLITAKDAVRIAEAERGSALVLEIAWDWMEGDVAPEKLVERVLERAGAA